MENASKALIIAGAILLSILIIGLGMFIYQQAANAMGDTGLSDQEITAFNSKFEDYEGTKRGSEVQALCKLVRNHNLGKSDDISEQVMIQWNTEVEATGDSSSVLTDDADTLTPATEAEKNTRAAYTYTVTMTRDKSSGKIYQIGIQQKK